MTSEEPPTVAEGEKNFEPEPARPLEKSVGFNAKRAGNREVLGVLAIIVAAILALYSRVGPVTSVVIRLIPFSADEAVGAKLAAFQRSTSRVADDARTAHVRELVATATTAIGHASPDRALTKAPVVTVLDDAGVNAFALPGGEIFILRGLLDAPEMNDDVLLGVLSHELAHAAFRHGLRSLIRRNLLRTGAAMMFGGIDGGTGALLGEGLTLGDLAYDRAMESEADKLAGEVLLALHRPVEPLANFLEKLDNAASLPALVMNHPPGRERASSLRAQAVQP